jgi:hypothetical protein
MDTSSDGVDPAKQQALERYREMKRKHGRLLAQNRHGGSHDTIWNSPFPTTSKYEICLFSLKGRVFSTKAANLLLRSMRVRVTAAGRNRLSPTDSDAYLAAVGCTAREQRDESEKKYELSEDHLKALQSVGQVSEQRPLVSQLYQQRPQSFTYTTPFETFFHVTLASLTRLALTSAVFLLVFCVVFCSSFTADHWGSTPTAHRGKMYVVSHLATSQRFILTGCWCCKIGALPKSCGNADDCSAD